MTMKNKSIFHGASITTTPATTTPKNQAVFYVGATGTKLGAQDLEAFQRVVGSVIPVFDSPGEMIAAVTRYHDTFRAYRVTIEEVPRQELGN